MRFINMTNHGSINEAIQKAEKLLLPESPLMKAVQEVKWRFGLEIFGPCYVYNYLFFGPKGSVYDDESDTHEPIKVFTYKPGWRFTKAIAMTNGDGAIHFNIYKINKTSLADKVSTILHEYAHLCGFSHGSNWRTREKELYSVPYYLSANASRWL